MTVSTPLIRMSRESVAATQEHACWLTLINDALHSCGVPVANGNSSQPWQAVAAVGNRQITQSDCSARWEAAEYSSQDALLGLKLPAQRMPTTLQAVSLTCLACPDLGMALATLSRYLPLTTRQVRLEVRGLEQQAQLVLHPIGLPHRQHLYAVTAYIIQLLQRLHEQAPAQLQVEMPLTATEAQAAEAILGCRVIPGSAHLQICLPREMLDTPLPGADDMLLNGMHDTLGNLLARTPTHCLIEQVKNRIVDLMSSGEVSEKAIAEPMKISPRHLRRKLSQQGTTYEQLVDEVRRDNALRLITDQHLSLTEIAYELGFLDPSSFTRAFRRWTDMSPTGYRRQILGNKRRLTA